MTREEDKYKLQLTTYLSQFVTENKKQKVCQVLENRTRAVTVVLEDIYKSHNASAVLRTCDCLGIQDVHVIENVNTYKFNPHVLRGCANWLSISRYNENKATNTRNCLNALKKQGYKLYATSLDPSSKSYNSVDCHDKVALIFGSEYLGISDTVIEMADELIHIPMMGFTESFNVSVSAAVVLSDVLPKIKNHLPDWPLNDSEKQQLTFDWYKSIVKNADTHINSYLKSLS